MLLFGAVRLAAYRLGSKSGRRPDGSFPARPPTHAVGHVPPLATDSLRATTVTVFAQTMTAMFSPKGGQTKATHRGSARHKMMATR